MNRDLVVGIAWSLVLAAPTAIAADAYPSKPIRMVVVAGTPEAFAEQQRSDLERWAKVIKAANVRVE